jgi:hypothetical protein
MRSNPDVATFHHRTGQSALSVHRHRVELTTLWVVATQCQSPLLFHCPDEGANHHHVMLCSRPCRRDGAAKDPLNGPMPR